MKNITITDEIREAIIKACESVGSQTELGSLTGVNPVYIGRYIAKKNKKMSLEVFQKLIPVITPFFSDEYSKQIDMDSSVFLGYISRHKEDISLSDRVVVDCEFAGNIIGKIVEMILDDQKINDSDKIYLRKKIHELAFDYEKELVAKARETKK